MVARAVRLERMARVVSEVQELLEVWVVERMVADLLG
jgi:hypothetical protein